MSGKKLPQGTILYVGNFELPDKGASANRVMTNRLLFREAGYRTAYLGVIRGERFAGVRQSDFDPDVYERVYPASTRAWLEQAYSLKDIAAVAERYDDLRFVVFYNTPYSLVRRAHRVFPSRGVKVLYDCTEWNPETQGNPLKRLYKRYDAYRVRNHLERCVDGLIVISSLMERQYQKKPRLLLPPLVDVKSPLWKQERTRKDGIFEFCYAGDPSGKDDICLLVDAFVKLSRDNSRLVVMGVSQEEFQREHTAYVPVLSARPEQIRFLGKVPHDQVICQLRNTDCFVMIRQPTLRNQAGFPTKFAEAYTSGTRIITTDVSDIRRYPDPAILIVPEVSATAIAQAMEKAMTIDSGNGIRDAFDYRRYIYANQAFLEAFEKEINQ